MTFADAYRLATSVFPGAQVERDNDGQWIVYTNEDDTDED